MNRLLCLSCAFIVGCNSGFEPLTEEPDSKRSNRLTMHERVADIRAELIARLWETPLGKTYRSFMTDPLPPARVNEMSKEMTARLFEEPKSSLTRISILQLLTEDLYEKGRLDTDTQARLVLLEGDVSLVRVRLSKTPLKEMALHSIFIGAISIPFGSPKFKEHVWNLANKLFKKLRLGKELPLRPKVAGPRQPVYKPWDAVTAFLNIFGPYSLIYLFLWEWRETPAGDLIEDRLARERIEQLVAEAATY